MRPPTFATAPFPLLWFVFFGLAMPCLLLESAERPAFRSDQPGSALDGAQVTLPYGELRELIEAARTRDEGGGSAEVPPLESLLVEARYRLDLSGGTPVLETDYVLRTFAEGWHKLPLVGGELRLERAEIRTDATAALLRNPEGGAEGGSIEIDGFGGGDTVAGPEATAAARGGRPAVFWEDGAYAVLVRGAGDFALTLRFGIAENALSERGGGLPLRPAPATVSELRVAGLPQGRRLRIEGQEPVAATSGETRYALPGDPGELRIWIEEELPADEVASGTWVLHSQTLVRYGDGRLGHEARVQARAEGGPGAQMVLALPPKSSGVLVQGEGLASWRVLTRHGIEARRLVELEWDGPVESDRLFQLSWDLPESPLATEWEIAAPQVAVEGGPREGGEDSGVSEAAFEHADSRALVAVLPVEGMEWRHPTLSGREGGLRLPDWLRDRVGDEAVFAAELVGGESLKLEVEWLPRVETAQATVTEAEFETRLVADGSMLVTARYQVQHAAPMDWLLDLPGADQILACELGGVAVRPVRRGADGIVFRLPSPAAGAGETGTLVTVCYAAEVPRLDPVSGALALSLPMTELFIHRLEWHLHLPEAYEASAVEGNVQLAVGKKGSASGGVVLEKLLCRGERPMVELHYRRRDLETER